MRRLPKYLTLIAVFGLGALRSDILIMVQDPAFATHSGLGITTAGAG